MTEAAVEAGLPPAGDDLERFAAVQGRAREAAAAYTAAFESYAPDLCRAEDPDDERVLPEIATVTIMRLPTDAVLRSSNSAARAYLGPRSAARGGTTTLPAPARGAGAVAAVTARVVGRVSGVLR